MPTPNDFSNAVTATVIILVFVVAYLFSRIKEKPKEVVQRPAKPVVPPYLALVEMREIILNAESVDEMKCIAGLKASFREDYKDVFTEEEIKASCLFIADEQLKRSKEIWAKNEQVVLLIRMELIKNKISC